MRFLRHCFFFEVEVEVLSFVFPLHRSRENGKRQLAQARACPFSSNRFARPQEGFVTEASRGREGGESKRKRATGERESCALKETPSGAIAAAAVGPRWGKELIQIQRAGPLCCPWIRFLSIAMRLRDYGSCVKRRIEEENEREQSPRAPRKDRKLISLSCRKEHHNRPPRPPRTAPPARAIARISRWETE